MTMASEATKRPPPRAVTRTTVAAKPRAAAMESPGSISAGLRMVLVGVEGIGKTTIGAMADEPVIVMAPDELGYLTLRSRGLVPDVPVMRPSSWDQLIASLDALASDPRGRRTVVLDAMAGMESLLAQDVCKRHFGGDWGERGFAAYGRGAKVVGREWTSLFPRLTTLASRGMDVLLLGHARVRRFNSPDGPDYDRYECNVATEDVWARTKAWAEAVLFFNFRPIVDQARPEANVAKAHGKAIAHQRIMRCCYSPSADAKNQYGLKDEYAMPDDPAECAAAFWALMKGGAK